MCKTDISDDLGGDLEVQIISLWPDRGRDHPPFVNWLILNWLTENCNLCKMASLRLHNKSSAMGSYLVPRRFNVQIQFFTSPSSHNPNNLAQQCPCWFWLQFCFSPPCQHCKPCSCRARDNLTPCHLVVCFVFAVVYCLWLVNLFDSAAIDPKSPRFSSIFIFFGTSFQDTGCLLIRCICNPSQSVNINARLTK